MSMRTRPSIGATAEPLRETAHRAANCSQRSRELGTPSSRKPATSEAGISGIVARDSLLLIGIAVAGVMRTDTPSNVFSLLTLALIGPVVSIWLGWHLGRPELTRPPATTTAPAS